MIAEKIVQIIDGTPLHSQQKSIGWRSIKIKELSVGNRPAVKAGPFGSALKKECFVPSGYKVYRQEQVIRGNAQYGNYYISEDKYNKLKSCSVVPGDVLISLVGTAGRVLVIHESDANGVINPRLLRLSLDSNQILPMYLKLFFEDTQTTRLLKRWSQGGTMDVLNAGMVENLKITLPPLPEQKAIASVLECGDKAIQKYEEKIEKKNIKKGLMQRLLSRKQRLPGFDGEWALKNLDDFCTRVTRKNNDGCERILTISGSLGLIDQREYYERRIASKDASNYYLMKKGEFAYNGSKCIGYPFGVIKRLEYFTDGAVSTLYTCFRIRNKIALPDYAVFLFGSEEIYRSLYGVCCEGARSHGLLNIPAADFLGIKVYIPPLPEQRAIASILSASDSEIKALKKKLSMLHDQKKFLLNNLVTGSIRLPEFCEGEVS